MAKGAGLMACHAALTPAGLQKVTRAGPRTLLNPRPFPCPPGYKPPQAELARQRDLNTRMRHELAEQAQAAEEAANAEEAEASQLASSQKKVAELESRLAELDERCQLSERLAEGAEEEKAYLAQQAEQAARAAADREAELQVLVPAV